MLKNTEQMFLQTNTRHILPGFVYMEQIFTCIGAVQVWDIFVRLFVCLRTAEWDYSQACHIIAIKPQKEALMISIHATVTKLVLYIKQKITTPKAWKYSMPW